MSEVHESGSSRAKVLSPVGKELLNIGVSRKAIATSLPSIGRDDIRTLIANNDFYDDDGQIKNIVVVRGKKGDANDANLLLQLIAKEIYLMGDSADMFTVGEFLFSIRNESYGELSTGPKLDSDWFFVSDFYKTHSNDSGPMLSIENAAWFESQMRYHYYRRNTGLCFYVGGELSDINKWWSDDFCQFVKKTSIEVKVR